MIETGFAAAFIALAVTRKDGIGGVFKKLRQSLPSFTPLQCAFCCAFWSAVALCFQPNWKAWLIESLASSGLACVVLALAGALDLDS